MIFTATLLSFAYSDSSLAESELPWSSQAALDYQYRECYSGVLHAANYRKLCLTLNPGQTARGRSHTVLEHSEVEATIARTMAMNDAQISSLSEQVAYHFAGANKLERCSYHFLERATNLFRCIANADVEQYHKHGFLKIVDEISSAAVKAYDPLGQDVRNRYLGAYGLGSNPWRLSSTGLAALRAFQSIHNQADQLKEIIHLRLDMMAKDQEGEDQEDDADLNFAHVDGIQMEDKDDDTKATTDPPRHDDPDSSDDEIEADQSRDVSSFNPAQPTELRAPVKQSAVEAVSNTKTSDNVPSSALPST